eukprot:TRINITY_DN102055_c0_g1_i1.p1 TRINITY_DN102055_c0_g1~~TRINITY_DN102055_c0_g1_i1.p1  ORF type:complete len:502 (+),score=92.53 TRINITY_DN102055_c0_g1_i1:66-1571(+)
MPEIEREFLAKSHVLATFNGIMERPCMAYIHPPPEPQRFAEFTIHEYIEYEKPGKYGDEQTDRHGVELGKEQSPEVIAAIEELQPGELVELAWQHDYVTWSEDGGERSTKYPERPVYIIERASRLLLTVAQGEQGQDGSVPITLITMAGEEAANFAFDGVPLLADVRNAASEALQVHPLQLDFVDMNGTLLCDEVPEDAGAAPADERGGFDYATAPQLRSAAAPEIVSATMPQEMDATSTGTTTQPQLKPAASPSTFSAPPPCSQPQPQPAASPSTFSAPQPRASPTAAFTTSPSAFVAAPQPQACPVAMTATSVAPQARGSPVVMAATSPSMSGMFSQALPMAAPQPQMRQMSMAAPVTSTVAPQTLAPSLSFVAPGQFQSPSSMAPQYASAPGRNTFGIPQQQAYQIAAAPASYVAPLIPQQARPVAAQVASVPANFVNPQPCVPQQAVAPRPMMTAAAATPYSYSMTPRTQPCQMPSAHGMIPIFAAPQQAIYAAPQR